MSTVTDSGIPAVGPVAWGTHFCQFYDAPEDMADTLVPFFKAGLEAGERCHWVTSTAFDSVRATAALGAAYPRLDQAMARGQIIIVDRREWYQRAGTFSAQQVIDGWLASEAAGRDRGFTGYRLTGDTFWLEPHDWHAFTEYEAMVTAAFQPRRMVALCTYCMGRCGASEVLDVVSNHAFAVARRRGSWDVIESASTKLAKAELARLNATLEAQVEAAVHDLRELVAHKDALLREVHHRVKNNLQVVSNLLMLKGRGADPEVRRALDETAARVHAIAAVHEALYGGMRTEGVPMLERLRLIAARLHESYGTDPRITIDVEGEEMLAPLDKAVPLALIATELVSNAFKHAFPGDRAGRIALHLAPGAGTSFELTVADDGVGWAPGVVGRGAGVGIVAALVRQLGGDGGYEPRAGGGTSFRLTGHS